MSFVLPRMKCKGGNHYTTNHSGYCGICAPKPFNHRFEGRDAPPFLPDRYRIQSQTDKFRKLQQPGPYIEKGSEDEHEPC
jgi:hypothetical protein